MAVDSRQTQKASILRRVAANAIDALGILFVTQLILASLYLSTNGQVQGQTWFFVNLCGPANAGVLPPLEAGAFFIDDCSETVFGLPTARLLAARHNDETRAPEYYYLNKEGGLVEGRVIVLDWLAFALLLVYRLIAEARGGATFGKRLAGLRVASVNDTKQRGLPIARATIRTAVLAPALALLLYSSFSFGLTFEPGDGAPAIWTRSRLGAGAIVPMVWLGILWASVFASRVALHDRIAGTIVLKAT